MKTLKVNCRCMESDDYQLTKMERMGLILFFGAVLILGVFYVTYWLDMGCEIQGGMTMFGKTCI